ncbi:MAG: hypothetical protein RI907_1963 [Pseudomonadota bacterium]|jgi:hypothetical protein
MHTEPNDLARKLGYAGLIPFVGCALLLWLLADREDAEPFIFVVRALSTYAALIVSFLGGIPWGLVMRTAPAADQDADTTVTRALWGGIGYSLAAWVGVLMPPHAGLAWLGGLLIVCYALDRKRYPELDASGWLTMRFRLTVVASLSCFFAAAQL